MKELEVTLRVRNNRLKQRRDDLGFTQEQLASAAGITLQTYGALENMTLSPLNSKSGDWTSTVIKLARFHCVEPEELFPPGVVNLSKPRAVRQIDVHELRTMLHAGEAPGPSKMIESSDTSNIVSKALAALTPREEKIVRMHFGFEGEQEMSLDQIGEKFQIGKARVSELLRKSLRKLQDRRVRNPIAKAMGMDPSPALSTEAGTWRPASTRCCEGCKTPLDGGAPTATHCRKCWEELLVFKAVVDDATCLFCRQRDGELVTNSNQIYFGLQCEGDDHRLRPCRCTVVSARSWCDARATGGLTPAQFFEWRQARRRTDEPQLRQK